MRVRPVPIPLLFVLAALALGNLLVVASTPVSFLYFYDDNNQLIKVVDSTGVVVEYEYDAVGNILQTKRSVISPTALEVFNVTPNHTGAGNTITILGQSFDTNPALDKVFINGVAAKVTSATNHALVVRVPTTAKSGTVSVTVAGVTAAWDSDIAILPLPVINSIKPHMAPALVEAAVTVTGVNLSGATFAFGPAARPPTISSVSIQKDGISASMKITGDGRGRFVLVATNHAGMSSLAASPANSFCIVLNSDAVDTDQDGLSDAQEIAISTDPCNPDTDGDGFSDGVEVASGSDPLDPKSTPLTGARSGDVESLPFSLLNKIGGPTQTLEAESLAFSVLNGSGSSAQILEAESPTFSVLNKIGPQVTGGEPPKVTGMPKSTASRDSRLYPPFRQPEPKNDLLAQGAEADTDGDGLSDGQERNLGTDLANADTDGDGFPDGLEVVLGSDPLDPKSIPDVRPPGIVAGPLFEMENLNIPIAKIAGKEQRKGAQHVEYPPLGKPGRVDDLRRLRTDANSSGPRNGSPSPGSNFR